MNNYDEDGTHIQIDLKKIFTTLFLNKLFIVLFTLIIFISSVIFSLSIPNKYSANILLKSSHESNSSLPSNISQFSNLAGMAGINLPSSENNNFYVIEKLNSKSFFKHLVSFEDIKAKLFASKSFDVIKNEIIYYSDIYNDNEKKWVREPKSNFFSEPSYQEVYRDIIQNQFSASLNPKTNFILLTFEHYSPIFAKEYLDLVIRELNRISAEEDLLKSFNALEFLYAELEKAKKKSISNSINELIKLELNKIMIIRSDKNYLVTPIDQPHVPEFKSSPSRFFIVAISTLIGFLMSILISLIRHSYK